MIKKLILLLAVISYSCSEQDSLFHIQDELQPYYQNFKDEAARRGVIITDENLIMTIEPWAFSKYGGNGVTRKTKDQTYIYIDKDWFNKRGELIEMTIFHELGHAKLNREHNNTSSLMNPNISGGKGWSDCNDDVSDCRRVLINELFKVWL